MKLQVGSSADGTFTTVFSFLLSNSTNSTLGSTDGSISDSVDALDDKFTQLLQEDSITSNARSFRFGGFKSVGRFFRLYCDDNFGNSRLEVNNLILYSRTLIFALFCIFFFFFSSNMWSDFDPLFILSIGARVAFESEGRFFRVYRLSNIWRRSVEDLQHPFS
jgi:hypothetical protein